MLRLRLVGEIAAEVDGDGRPLPPGRPRALLGWLALRPGPHPRTAVALASSGPTSSTRAPARASAARSGRCAARSARRRSSRHATASASRQDTWVDVLEAERLRAEGRGDEALALREGPFLPGLDDEWALEAQEEHRDRLVVAARGACGRRRARHGDLRAAVALTRRQAALEPLSEEIHRALMRRLDAAGDRGAALAEYTELRSRLVTRLRTGAVTARRSSSPKRCAKELPQRRRAGVSGAPAPRRPGERSSAAPASSPGSTPPGSRVAAGGGAAQVVLLAGEAGIGKSRLTARFAAEASAAGATVLYGACEEQSLVPYAPFSEADRRQGAGAGGDRGVPDRCRRGRPARARARRPPSRRPQHAGAAWRGSRAGPPATG